MLLIIELLFLAAGLWAVIRGEVPQRIFSVLFGSGEYTLPPMQARLFGLLLASPWPVAFAVSVVLGILLRSDALGYALLFEIVYDIGVLVTAVLVARKIRRPAPSVTGGPTPTPAAARKINNYGVRVLIMLTMVTLGLIAVGSACTLVIVGLSTLFVGTASSGSFLSDFLPILLTVLVMGLAAFGTFRLFKLLSATGPSGSSQPAPSTSPPADR